jgi:hypothetical protein
VCVLSVLITVCALVVKAYPSSLLLECRLLAGWLAIRHSMGLRLVLRASLVPELALSGDTEFFAGGQCDADIYSMKG